MVRSWIRQTGVTGPPALRCGRATRSLGLAWRSLSLAWLFVPSLCTAAEPPRGPTAPAGSFRRPGDPPSLTTERPVVPNDRERGAVVDGAIANGTLAPHGPRKPSASPAPLSADGARASFQWIAGMAMKQLPRTHTGDSGWGDTKKLWAGVKLRREGWKLTTDRRFREVRHGRWARYTLTLPAAERTERAAARVRSAERDRDGRWRIDAVVTAPLDFRIRVERWNFGIQWYSLSVTGELRVQLRSSVTVGFRTDYTEVPPKLCVEPRVDRAQLVLRRFEVDRISKVGGDAAEEMGEVMEELIRELWLDKANERLAEKLNAAIERHRDDLQWSPADWLAGGRQGAVVEGVGRPPAVGPENRPPARGG